VEWIAGIGLVVTLVVVRRIAARRIAVGDGRFAWIYFEPTLLVMAWMIWIAVGIWAIQPLAAIGMGLASAVSLVLLTRAVGRMVSDAGNVGAIGELSPPLFDYLVWTSIGLPVLAVIGLLVYFLLGVIGKPN
jgi:hypothetical protein